jgi:hypothetical protein
MAAQLVASHVVLGSTKLVILAKLLLHMLAVSSLQQLWIGQGPDINCLFMDVATLTALLNTVELTVMHLFHRISSSVQLMFMLSISVGWPVSMQEIETCLGPSDNLFCWLEILAQFEFSSLHCALNLLRLLADFGLTFIGKLMIQHCKWPPARQWALCSHRLSIKGVIFCPVAVSSEKIKVQVNVHPHSSWSEWIRKPRMVNRTHVHQLYYSNL